MISLHMKLQAICHVKAACSLTEASALWLLLGSLPNLGPAILSLFLRWQESQPQASLDVSLARPFDVGNLVLAYQLAHAKNSTADV